MLALIDLGPFSKLVNTLESVLPDGAHWYIIGAVAILVGIAVWHQIVG